MRTFSIWRHALFALSLLTLSSSAFAGTPPGQAAKAEHPSASHHKDTKHVKRKTATVPKAKPSKIGDRVRSSKAHAKAAKAKDSKAAADKPTAAKSQHSKPTKTAHGKTAKRAESAPRAQPKPAPKACLHEPVTIVRGADEHAESMVLTRCNGRPLDGALSRFSTFIAPSLASSSATPHKSAKGTKTSHSVKQLDVGLLHRLQAVATHFPGHPLRIASSYRPLSARSYHQTGRAVDLVVTGVKNEDLVAFCRTLPDTGCGYYPNSSFVHIDVRSPGTGHVYWIDASKPGEPSRYVTSWPESTDSSDKAQTHPSTSGEDHPSEHSDASEGSTPPASAPASKQPLTGDLELDSKQEEKKAR